MKTLPMVALVLVSCTSAAAECVEVPSLETSKPSSKNATITVLLDGKPVRQAKLSVRLPEGRGQRSLVTDSDGKAALNNLPEGTSCVTATAENNFSADLCLMVSARSADVVSFFSVILSAPLPPLLSFDDRVRRAEQSGTSLRLRKLAGTVVDQNEALIPNADVQIYRRGKYPEGLVTTLKTDETGRFGGSFGPGLYTLIIHVFGFKTRVLGLEISPDGSERERDFAGRGYRYLRLNTKQGLTDTR